MVLATFAGTGMRVSVVIPAYNVSAYIGRCLKSIIDQTHGDLEVICVDDGSTDDTAALIERQMPDAPWPIELVRQPNRGASAARNTGAALASGAYIQFMDADDVLLPGKIAHQVRSAEENNMPGLIIGSFRLLSPTGEVVEIVEQRTAARDPWMDLMRHRMGGTPQNLWRRDLVQLAGGWNEELKSSQEYDLMFRMMELDMHILYDPIVLTEIHQREGGSISQVDLKNNWLRFIKLRSAIIEHLKKIGKSDLKEAYQVLFDSIRTLYPYDPSTARALYNELIPTDFEPSTSSATGRGYLIMHRLLGFDRANRLRTALADRKGQEVMIL